MFDHVWECLVVDDWDMSVSRVELGLGYRTYKGLGLLTFCVLKLWMLKDEF